MYLPRSRVILVLLLVVLIVMEMILGQSSGSKRKNRNRNRKRKKTESEPRVKCMTCYVDFRVKFDPNSLCYNPTLNQTLADELYLSQCSPFTRYCTVDIGRINKVLGIIDRRCGPANPPQCHPFCFTKGYGVEMSVCTYCCDGKVTEDDDDYDPDIHANYTCPTVPH